MPQPHWALGAGLALLGMEEPAAAAFQTCLKLEPGNFIARRWLVQRERRKARTP